jgi:Rrf2 family protein
LNTEAPMDRLVNISDRCAVAIHALALAALEDGRITSARCAKELGVSPSYLAKVLQSLVRRGFLRSTRGPAGGFELTREASTISCLEVVEAIEGALPERDCLFPKAVCAKKGCGLMAMCERANEAVRKALETATIASMASSYEG